METFFSTATHLSAKFLKKRDDEDFLSSNLINTILTLPYEEIVPVIKIHWRFMYPRNFSYPLAFKP